MAYVLINDLASAYSHTSSHTVLSPVSSLSTLVSSFSFNSKSYSQLRHLYLFLSPELGFHWFMRLNYFHLSTSSWNDSSCIGPTLSKETHPFKFLSVSYIFLFISFLALIIILCFLWTDQFIHSIIPYFPATGLLALIIYVLGQGHRIYWVNICRQN